MKSNYSKERRQRIGNLNKNRIFSPEEKRKLRDQMILRYEKQPNLKKRISEA
jgi:hypothetical protein